MDEVPQGFLHLLPAPHTPRQGKLNAGDIFTFPSGQATDREMTAHWDAFGEAFIYFLTVGERLAFYIDFDAIAPDLAVNYTETEIVPGNVSFIGAPDGAHNHPSRTTRSLRAPRSASLASGRLPQCLQISPSLENTHRPNALRIHLQNIDLRAT